VTIAFQTKPLLGKGIYTVPDIAMILGIPYSKVNRWITSFWNDRFAISYGESYSWKVDLTKAVNFHTLVEIYTFFQLSQAGVSSKNILIAHDILSKQLDTPYPFAKRDVINQLRTDGQKVMIEQKDGSIYTIDAHMQFKLKIIKDFFKNLDFDSNAMATRFWPLGKGKSVVCDPHHQFGQPVINGTNIVAEVIADMVKAGDHVDFVARTYGLRKSQVEDAVEYTRKAA